MKNKTKNNIIKVLHTVPLGPGGISKLTITINKYIDRNRIKFDYLVFRDRKEFFEDDIIALDARKKIIDTENINNNIIKCLKKIIKMKKLFSKEKYNVVHIDASTPYDVIIAIAAKLAGIKTVIMHSHNDDFHKREPIRDLLMPVFKKIMLFTVTDYIAISEEAAHFMFPKEIIKKGKYKIMKNAVNISDYIFNEDDRNKVRKRLNIENKFVIGHIGRFVYQKNHEFIIDVFEELHKKNKESVLLLVGEGTLQKEIESIVLEKDLNNAVIFYGTSHNIGELLSAMDVFIFPSRFEGLGIVAIEAQTNGLPVCAADTIVEEVDITPYFFRIHDWDYVDWANQIDKLSRKLGERKSDYVEQIKRAGYSIEEVAKEWEKFYIERENNDKIQK